MFFIHVNGFYSLSKFVPREIALASIQDFRDIQLWLIRGNHFPTTEKDFRTNLYLSKHIHYLEFPIYLEDGAIDFDQWKIHEVPWDIEKVYVKGREQKKFFTPFFDEVVNLEDLDIDIPTYREQVPLQNIPIVDHGNFIHRHNNVMFCSSHIAYYYARQLQKRM